MAASRTWTISEERFLSECLELVATQPTTSTPLGNKSDSGANAASAALTAPGTWWEWVPEKRDPSGTLRLRPGYLRLQRQLVTAVRPAQQPPESELRKGARGVFGHGHDDERHFEEEEDNDDGHDEYIDQLNGHASIDSAELTQVSSCTASPRVAEFEYHVLYSQPYAVPVLYFSVTELDGTPVGGDDAVWEYVLQHLV